MSEKLIVSWEEYNQTVEKLALQIHESDYKPTILIGIMRGAAPMIDVLRSIIIPEEVISSHLSILNSPACCKPSAIMQNLPSSIVQTLL